MRITTIQGSPQKNGNTASVLGMFEERALEQGHKVERIDIIDYEVKGCRGCRVCHSGSDDEPGCAQQDDAEALLKRMIASDAVIYASPLYKWDVSPQLKLLFSRHYSLVKNYGMPNFKSLLEGKRTALLVTCGGPIENNADLVQELFDRQDTALKCHMIGKYILPFCTTPEALGNEARQIAEQMIEDFGQRI